MKIFRETILRTRKLYSCFPPFSFNIKLQGRAEAFEELITN